MYAESPELGPSELEVEHWPSPHDGQFGLTLAKL